MRYAPVIKMSQCPHLSFSRMDDGIGRRVEERKIKEGKGKEREGMGEKENQRIGNEGIEKKRKEI